MPNTSLTGRSPNHVRNVSPVHAMMRRSGRRKEQGKTLAWLSIPCTLSPRCASRFAVNLRPGSSGNVSKP